MTSLALTVAFTALSLASDETPESELSKYRGRWVLVSEEFGERNVFAFDVRASMRRDFEKKLVERRLTLA